MAKYLLKYKGLILQSGDEYMDKRTKYERAKQEDALFARMIYWIIGVVVLEFVLLMLNRYYVNGLVSNAMSPVVKAVVTALCVVFPLAFLALAYCYLKAKKAGVDASKPFFGAVITLALSICFILVRLFYGSGVSLLYLAVPAVAVLAIIYYLYQREFFAMALSVGLSLLGIYLGDHVSTHTIAVYAYIAVFLVVIILALTLFRRNSAGKPFKIAGQSLTLFPQSGVNYPLLAVTNGLAVLVVAISLFTTISSVLYGVLVAWILIMAVYYTVKLM